jgi:hypothetical protein
MHRLIVATLLTLSFCSKPDKSADIITIPLKYRAEILDPLYAVDEATVLVVNFLHRRLYAYSPDGKLEPDLALGESQTGRRVIIQLKAGGATADDVVYALNRVQRTQTRHG